MFQPQDPNIWRSGNRIVEDLVSRGGGQTWNPETQQWQKFWQQESYIDPRGGLTTFNPVLNDWFHVMSSPRLMATFAKAKRQPELAGPVEQPAQKQPDFMDMFGPYITGDYLRK